MVQLLKERGLTKAGISGSTGVSLRAVYDAVKGKPVNLVAAKAVSEALGRTLNRTFTTEKNSRTLSPKTVIEHHRLISTVLD